MADELTQEIKSLSERMAQLEPKRMYNSLYRPILGEMRKVARKVANQAIRTSHFKINAAEFRKRSVRGCVRKDLQGGFVSTTPGKGRTAQYLTRRGKYKPIAMWAADGTEKRTTKAGKNRGRMPKFGFMDNGEILMYGVEAKIEKAIERRLEKLGL